MKQQENRELKFVDWVIWVDPKPAENQVKKAQIAAFIFLLGHSFISLKRPDEIFEMFDTDELNSLKILVICSSVQIRDCYKVFGQLKSVYSKYLVYCGSPQRADFIIKTPPENRIVDGAFTQLQQIVQKIFEMDQEFNKTSYIFQIKVNLDQKQTSAVGKSQQIKAIQNRQEKLQKVIEKKQQKIQDVTASGSSKFPQNIKLIWFYKSQCKNAEQSRQKFLSQNSAFLEELSREGYPAQYYDIRNFDGRQVQVQDPIVIISGPVTSQQKLDFIDSWNSNYLKVFLIDEGQDIEIQDIIYRTSREKKAKDIIREMKKLQAIEWSI